MKKSPRKTALPPFITADELGFVRTHLLLGIVLSVFERDKTAISKSDIKTPAPYVDMIDRAMDEATFNVSLIRQYFRKAGIKILTETRDSDGYTSKYVCRGYDGEFRMLNGYLAARLEVMKRKALGEDVTRLIETGFPK